MRSTMQGATFAVLMALAESKPLTPHRLEGNNLHKRAVTDVQCGLYSSASITDNGKNYYNLKDKGDLAVVVIAGTCSRIGCYNNSGVYVCNDSSEDLDVPMSEVVEHMQYLMSICIGGNSIGKKAVSGRVMVDDHEGYNLNIGYCSRDEPVDITPGAYSNGERTVSDEKIWWPGPNGDPDITCGREDEAMCDGGSCKENSIVIESQKTVTCQSYLGGSYIGPGANVIYNTQRTISEAWNIGGWLGIDTGDLAKMSGVAGFGGGFTETTTTGASHGISAPCGDQDVEGDFTCALHIRPQCFEMAGYCTDAATDQKVPWANTVPQDAGDGSGVFNSNVCTCGECPDADNPGAPELCELECRSECL